MADIILDQLGLKTDDVFKQTDVEKIDGNATKTQDAINSNSLKIGNLTTDVESINLKIDDISNPLTVTLTLNPSVAEKGSTVTSQILTWTTSKDIASQTLNSASIDKALRTSTYTTSTTADKIHTLICTTTAGASISKSATLSFANGIYYGVSSTTGTYNSALISSLTKVLSNSRARTITVNAGSGQYIYYCLESSLGNPTFTCNGFTGGFSKVASALSFTNASGNVSNFDIWKSDNSGLGSTTLVIL